MIPEEVIRATEEEKKNQIASLENLHQTDTAKTVADLKELQDASVGNKNIFEHLMETVKSSSLGQITNSLYEVGGQYRRNM